MLSVENCFRPGTPCACVPQWQAPHDRACLVNAFVYFFSVLALTVQFRATLLSRGLSPVIPRVTAAATSQRRRLRGVLSMWRVIAGGAAFLGASLAFELLYLDTVSYTHLTLPTICSV